MNKYKYNKAKFCVAKGKYIDQMIIKTNDSKLKIVLRHVMDRQGGYSNYFHVYSNKDFTNGMEYRPRKDGDSFYLKLNRENVVKLLGEDAVKF